MRHGATAATPDHRFIGSTDLGLSVGGRQQLAAAAHALHGYQPERCFCSPMRRCVETAHAVLPSPNPETELLPDLREIDFGDWENFSYPEMQVADAAGVERWGRFDHTFQFPGGERLGDFAARIKSVAGQIATSPEKTVVVITHGGVIRFLACHFLGLPLRRYLLFDVGPGSLMAINVFDNGKGLLTALVPCNGMEKQ